jgi:UDP-3-O-[3-hydroxymyristoyl] glucosamine N-acyltransferase
VILAQYYFKNDPKYEGIELSGFCVSDEFHKENKFQGLPVIKESDIDKKFPKEQYYAFIALSYKKMNLSRIKVFEKLKSMNYNFVSYVSSKSSNSKFTHGNNCFILENQTIQNNVKIGNNVTIWSSNHIGHSSVIKDHTYISSHVCIGGRTKIGEGCFIGINSGISDGLNIGNSVFISMGSNISKNIENQSIVIQNPSKEIKKNDKLYQKLKSNILKKY